MKRVVTDQPHEIDKLVGDIIRAKRKLSGMSQQALAESVKVSFQQIQKYERGANRVSASKLWEIAGALDAEIAEFFPERRAKRRGGREVVLSMVASPHGLAIADAFSRMEPKHQSAVRGLAEQLVS